MPDKIVSGTPGMIYQGAARTHHPRTGYTNTLRWIGEKKFGPGIEQQLIAERYDIRPVDIDKEKALAKSYKVGPIPCFVAVKEVSPGVWRETGRIVGKCTAGQLRRLCVIPKATTIGAASRSAVRALFTPCPVLEW